MNAPDDPRPAVSESADPAAGEDRSGAARDRESTHRRQRMPLWLDTLITMAVALVIAVLVKTFLIQPFYIPSASMNPTLLEDDKILVSKLSPGVFDIQTRRHHRLRGSRRLDPRGRHREPNPQGAGDDAAQHGGAGS